MNIETSIIDRVTSRYSENKNPCKSYKTKEAADRATMQAALEMADEFTSQSACEKIPARYILVFIPAMGRWVGALDMTEMLRRSTSQGGYLGVCKGFYKY